MPTTDFPFCGTIREALLNIKKEELESEMESEMEATGQREKAATIDGSDVSSQGKVVGWTVPTARRMSVPIISNPLMPSPSAKEEEKDQLLVRK